MNFVYIFMAAWISGGVLLGSNLLLEHASDTRLGAQEELSHPPANEDARRAQGPRSPVLHVVALALIGFGLGGLIAEGLELARQPWSSVIAVASAGALGGFGWLSRGPSRP